jgi:GMP synthase-like glutamine amidotransferase
MHQLGGEVRLATAANSAAPLSRFDIARCSTACGAIGEKHQVWMSHGDKVTAWPPVSAGGVQPRRALRRDRRR